MENPGCTTPLPKRFKKDAFPQKHKNETVWNPVQPGRTVKPENQIELLGHAVLRSFPWSFPCFGLRFIEQDVGL